MKLSVRLDPGPATSNKMLLRTDQMKPTGRRYLVNSLALGLDDFPVCLDRETLDLSSLL